MKLTELQKAYLGIAGAIFTILFSLYRLYHHKWGAYGFMLLGVMALGWFGYLGWTKYRQRTIE